MLNRRHWSPTIVQSDQQSEHVTSVLLLLQLLGLCKLAFLPIPKRAGGYDCDEFSVSHHDGHKLFSEGNAILRVNAYNQHINTAVALPWRHQANIYSNESDIEHHGLMQ